MELKNLKCPNCGKSFTTNNHRKKYCCNDCMLISHNLLNNKKKHCPICNKPLPRHKKKFCSTECYKIGNAHHVSLNPYKGNTSATTGAISELRTSIDLMSKGFHIFRALSPNCPCDLIALTDSQIFKIEVRTQRKHTSGKRYISHGVNDNQYKKFIDNFAYVYPDIIIYEPPIIIHGKE